ncbi:MAG TPA: hypothetical protein VK503_03155 [Candidatus Bathyarchaeia archaeon]|nr:hypothetical protein [Candidatus Bathyarchaeia archaeon]
MLTRKLFIVLLILSAVGLLHVPYVNSQSISSSTSVFLSTLTSTVTSYSTSVSGVTYTIVGTTTINDYVNGRIGSCYLSWYFFNSTESTTHISYSAGQQATFYILKFSEWTEWISSDDPCHPKSVTYQGTLSSSGSIDLTLPTSGNSYALVIIASSSTNPSIKVTLGPALIVSRSTVSTAIPLVSTRTDTTAVTSIATAQGQSYENWMVAIVLIVIVAIGLAIWIAYTKPYASKRRPRRKAKRTIRKRTSNA